MASRMILIMDADLRRLIMFQEGRYPIMNIKKFDLDFTICKVPDYSQINLDSDFCFLGKTDEELSLVCLTCDAPAETLEREDGWKAFRIEGVLDFFLIGILAKISAILAEHRIGIFVVSTFNTDYILTKAENYPKALLVLQEAGYTIVS